MVPSTGVSGPWMGVEALELQISSVTKKVMPPFVDESVLVKLTARFPFKVV